MAVYGVFNCIILPFILYLSILANLKQCESSIHFKTVLTQSLYNEINSPSRIMNDNYNTFGFSSRSHPLISMENPIVRQKIVKMTSMAGVATEPSIFEQSTIYNTLLHQHEHVAFPLHNGAFTGPQVRTFSEKVQQSHVFQTAAHFRSNSYARGYIPHKVLQVYVFSPSKPSILPVFLPR